MSTIETGNLITVWKQIEGKLLENSKPYEDINAVYEFHLTDIEDAVYQLVFKNGKVKIYDHSEGEVGCTLKMKEKYFRKFLLGDLNSTAAFMTGKLKVDGNIGQALKLEGLLKQYDFTN